MVVSNPKGLLRNQFYAALNVRKSVDSGGKYLNNVGGPVPDKLEFLSKYRFSFAFENSSYPGYTTEKILESKRAGTVPIYWGNPLVNEDFNSDSFINVHNFSSITSAVDHILEVESDPVLYDKLRKASLLKNYDYTPYSNRDLLLDWLENAIKGGIKRSYWPIFKDFSNRISAWKTRRFDYLERKKLL